MNIPGYDLQARLKHYQERADARAADKTLSSAEQMAEMVADAIALATEPLLKRIQLLEKALADKGWNYRGPWKPGVAYHKNDVVSFQGSGWIAQQANCVRPNDSSGHLSWSLFVKAGRDGKDLR